MDSDQTPTAPSRWRATWRGWIRPLLFLGLALFSFRSAVADWNDVPTGSMKPTILEGDRIFVNKLAYDLKVPFTTIRIARWSSPQRGDLVVFRSPADDVLLVKRVVGVPGDTIQMKGNRLYLDGEPVAYSESTAAEWVDENDLVDLTQPHRILDERLGHCDHPILLQRSRPGLRSFPSLTVPHGKYFMMGDNRDDSVDSRWFGLVDGDEVLGRVECVVLSLNPREYYRPRWHRFFHELP